MRSAAVRSGHFPDLSKRVVTDINKTIKAWIHPFPKIVTTSLLQAQSVDWVDDWLDYKQPTYVRKAPCLYM